MKFKFNGISTDDMGCIVSEAPAIVKPQKRKEKIYVVGRDGYISYDDDTYDEFSMVYVCHLDESTGIKLQQVLEWLSGTGELEDSRRSEGYYKADVMHQVSYYEMAKGTYKFSVMFLCQPYFYLNSGKNSIELNNSSIVNFEGSKPIKPKFNITMNGGNVVLNVSDKTIRFENNKSSEVIVDCENHFVMTQQGEFIESIGEFPTISENTEISWEGSISKVMMVAGWKTL